MRDRLSDILEKHKDLFSESSLEISHCPDGWLQIFEAFCEDLSAYKKSYTAKPEKSLRNLFFSVCARCLGGISGIIRPKGHITRLYNEAPKKSFRGWLYDRTRKLMLTCMSKKRFTQVFPPNIKIDQFKEKFGGLRIYTNFYTERVGGMTSLAETLSMKTCEKTGTAGSLCRSKSSWPWYKTLSLDKAAEMGYIQVKQNGN